MLLILVCTRSPICSSDIATRSPLSRDTLAADGKQPDDDDDDGGGGSNIHSERNTINNITKLGIHRLVTSPEVGLLIIKML